MPTTKTERFLDLSVELDGLQRRYAIEPDRKLLRSIRRATSALLSIMLDGKL